MNNRSKKWQGVAASIMVLAVLAPGANAVTASHAAPSAVVARTMTVRPGGVHLSYPDDAIQTFKSRIAANAEVAAQWQKLKEKADRQVTLPVKDIVGDSRKLDDRIEPLVLAYRMTGDSQYAKKLHEILRNLCAQPNWVTDAPLLKRDPVWNSDLGMGVTSETFGLVYDSIRESLTPAERKELTDGFLQHGAQPVLNDWIDGEKRIHTLDTMGHNWWAHIVFGTGVGLIAISRDEPKAKTYLERLDAAGHEWWSFAGSSIETKRATFDADGGNIESVNYAELAIGTYLSYRLAWQEMFKEPPTDVPVLEKAVDFLITNAYPADPAPMIVNFGDGNMHGSAARAVANMYLTGTHRPDYLWYITSFASGGSGADLRYSPRYLVNIPLKSEKGGEGTPPNLPTSSWYRGIGWATLRTSWDKDATLLAVRSGLTWNHAHADAGSFVLFHKGKPLLIDSGNANYARPEYDAYYRQSLAHNVMTFNGKAIPEEDTYLGSHTPGQIPNLMDAAGFRYVFADATGPTSANFERNQRHFLWVDDVILVYDDLKAHEPGQFAFLLHTSVAAKRQGQDLNVVNGDASVTVRPLFPQPFPEAGLPTDYPENMRLEERLGYEDHNPDVRQPYYAFLPAEKAERQKFLTALMPNTDGPKPTIERLTGPDMIGVRLRKGDEITEVYFNQKADGSIRHRNATAALMGWETDAYILAVTYKAGVKPSPATIDRLFIADGSYLRRDGTLMLDSISKRFLIADFGPEPKFWIQGQTDSQLGLWLRRPARRIFVNDFPVSLPGSDSFVRVNCCG
jgi:hypothetical protein